MIRSPSQLPLANLEPVVPCLAMRPRQAAAALGISERLLWDWTNRGLVPCVRRGKAILYPVDALRRWLDEQAQLQAQTPPDNVEKEGDERARD